MRKKVSFSRSINRTAVIMFSVIAAVLGIVWITYEYIRFEQSSERLKTGLVDQQKIQLEEHVKTADDYISFYIQDSYSRLQFLLKEKTIEAEDFLLELDRTLISDLGKVDKFVDKDNDITIHLAFVDEKGKILFFSPDNSIKNQYIKELVSLPARMNLKPLYSSDKYFIGRQCEFRYEIGGKRVNYIGFTYYSDEIGAFITAFTDKDDFENIIKKDALNWVGRMTFFEETGYVFVVDGDGILLLNGAAPEVTGENIRNVKHNGEESLFDLFIRHLGDGKESFVQYKWNKPGEVFENKKTKISYIRKSDIWGWLIGAGFYLEDIDKTIEEGTKEAENKVRERIIYIILLMIIILLPIIFYFNYFIKKVRYNIDTLVDYFNTTASVHEKIDKDKNTIQEFDELTETINKVLSEWKLVQKELEDKEKRLSLALEATQDAIWEWNITDNSVFTSNRYFEMLGYSEVELQGNYDDIFLKLIHPKDKEELVDILNADLMSSKIDRFSVEYRLKTKSGDWKWVLSRGKVVEKDSSNKPLRIIGAHTDITSKRKFEHELEQSDQRFKMMLNQASDYIIVHDLKYNILEVNDYACEHFGYTREEFLSLKIKDIDMGYLNKDIDVTLIREYWNRKFVKLERIYRRKDGSTFPVEIHIGTLLFGNDKAVLLIARDITERKKFEQQILESEKKLSRLMRNLPGMVYRSKLDENYSVEFVSEGSLSLTGYTQDELISKDKDTAAKIIHPEDIMFVREAITDAVIEEKTFEVVYRIVTKEKNVKWVWEKGMPVKSEDEQVVLIEGFITDITEQKNKEKQLQHVQKMESIGTLAGGLAHDLNNVLGGILGATTLLDFQLSTGEEIEAKSLKKNLETIERSVSRATDMIKQLMTLSREDELSLTPVDLNMSVKHVIKICKNTFDKSIEINAVYGPEDMTVRADPTQIEQVILNLCINASHAMTLMRKPGEPQGGKLSVYVENQTLSKEDAITIHPDAKIGKYRVISVSDTGVGIEQKNQSIIFDPFYTTKEKGKGTGLGLSIVYNIVKQHNGFVKVYSEKEKGSTFKVYLPVFINVAKKKELEKKLSKIKKGEGLILVVDDDDLLRGIAEGMLTRCGYSVKTAFDGNDGLKVFSEYKDEIKCVLLDISMPGISSEETFSKMKESKNDVSVLLTSGFKKDDRIKKILSAGAKDFIEKPFTLESLSSKINEIIS